jgi:hypothetical protein
MFISYYGILNILVISFVISLTNQHKCKVKKAKMNFFNAYEEEGRFLQSSNWAPIRIYLDYTFFEFTAIKIRCGFQS